MRELAFQIEPLPPFRLDLTAWVLRRRPNNLVDRWDGETYRRVLRPAGQPVEVAVRQTGSVDAPRLEVLARGPELMPDLGETIQRSVETMLGTSVDLSAFQALAAGDPALGELAERLRGAKPTRYPTVFEGLVNAIACQQITLTFGQQILGRLIEECGAVIELDGERRYAFPDPRELLTVSPERLKELKLSGAKVRALLELSRGLVEGTIDLNGLEALDDAEVLQRLLALRGVGRWTAEYVMLRALGRLHIFPGDDVGGQNNLRKWLKLDERLDYAGVQRVLAAWKDWAGLLYFYLLLHGLDERGSLTP